MLDNFSDSDQERLQGYWQEFLYDDDDRNFEYFSSISWELSRLTRGTHAEAFASFIEHYKKDYQLAAHVRLW